ncbi:phage portal protein [Pediococcus inopinatus]|uniref:Phage portal protein n=1 Tax=Pediococcus inopinatus TaxID=114090 RepID=A0ABZ0Q424_9LACO|nr:phage portal protein [Pediococcus inopinatus]WPC20867.1 phage portal protein [Pediococcus inopinatus]
MSIISSFMDLFTRRKDSSFIYDIDLFQDTANRAYMKRLAIDEVLNFVARAASQTEFQVIQNKVPVKNDIYYHLNVRPNTDQSATDFWKDVVYKLLRDNEVLIIQDDSKDLLVADYFSRTERAVYPDTFSDVLVKDYQFKRTFSMDEVIYLTYSNDKLDNYITGLWGDYGKLIGRLYDIEMRNNQVRATVAVDTTTGTQEEQTQKLQSFINKIYKSFNENSVAIVPTTRGFEYKEVSGGTGVKNLAFSETDSVKNAFIDDVASLVGVPSALIHGSNAENKENMQLFNTYCLRYILKIIRDELNAKFVEPEDLMNEKMHIKSVGIDRPSIVDMAESIDKLGSSGMVTQNEVREAIGLPPRADGDQIVMTKNYTTKGGENDDNENQR